MEIHGAVLVYLGLGAYCRIKFICKLRVISVNRRSSPGNDSKLIVAFGIYKILYGAHIKTVGDSVVGYIALHLVNRHVWHTRHRRIQRYRKRHSVLSEGIFRPAGKSRYLQIAYPHRLSEHRPARQSRGGILLMSFATALI